MMFSAGARKSVALTRCRSVPENVMQIEHRICPKCIKVFYASTGAENLSCPYCGYVLLDRRRMDRTEAGFDVVFTLGEERIAARLENYSDGGVRIVYSGAPILEDIVLGVDIDGLEIHGHARAIWSKQVSGSTFTSGLKLI